MFSCTTHDNPKKEEWIDLFNGTDLTDWTIKFANQDVNVNHLNTFRAQASMIRIVYDQYDTFEDAYAHLYYKKPYSYYKLRFDYRFTGEQVPGGERWNVRNSGIMLHSQSAESNDYGQYFPVSIEIQSHLDRLNRHEKVKRLNSLRSVASVWLQPIPYQGGLGW